MMTNGKPCVAAVAAAALPRLTGRHPREVGPSAKVLADTIVVVVVADTHGAVVQAMDGGDNRPSVSDL
jgi:hypothetical protein